MDQNDTLSLDWKMKNKPAKELVSPPAPQLDTAQQRAEAIAKELWWAAGDSRLLRLMTAALQQARLDALAEARKLVSKVFDDAKTEKPDYYCALLDLGNALDRLREGREG